MDSLFQTKLILHRKREKNSFLDWTEEMTLLNDVLEAYLNPLLKKHNDGKYLTWEDLEASKVAAKKALGSSENLFVSVRCGGASNENGLYQE